MEHHNWLYIKKKKKKKEEEEVMCPIPDSCSIIKIWLLRKHDDGEPFQSYVVGS